MQKGKNKKRRGGVRVVQIVPLQGILYNPEKIKNMAEVIAPPYDVISPLEQDKLYQASPYNVVRLILNKETAQDTPTNNRYTRSANFFKKWQQENILIQDQVPAIYIYVQEFFVKGMKKTRKGFMARLKLEDINGGVVFPHEYTLAKPKEDRLKLMQDCQANFSPIFSLYQDDKKEIANIINKQIVTSVSLIEATDDKKVNHKLWRITDKNLISDLRQKFEDKKIFIADGHHRYETALNYRHQRRQKEPNFSGEESYNYLLSMFIEKDDAGLAVFPIHRLLRLPDKSFQIETFKQELSRLFSLEELTSKKDLFNKIEENKQKVVFGLYTGKKFYFLGLKKAEGIDELIKIAKPKVWKNLDVTILHKLIIEDILKIDAKKIEYEEMIKYTINEEEAIGLVDAHEYTMAFFLNATKIDQIIAVAAVGERMPQKSTYFYPKLITGLVINKL